ncbi:PDDEXK family nuclease [Sabulicella glaciei]|uniref:Endonuclease NucS n=1 Tax=Sabulicella glaciei TaxID=2984948 RepID=A0ABT3P0U2_9PROT|nr:endonuclease NucS [Roseococcus sp. MDT2-1-1]MCW8088035.1 endonuclease NucS [Roseococcus sp. MDT2-1-1]
MTRLWRVQDGKLREVQPSVLQREADIEGWIAADPGVLGLDVLVIGRQVKTAFGGVIDLLALDREGAVWIIECKRDKTPREVVAQILDYAAWVRTLSDRELDGIAGSFLGRPLSLAFQDWAGDPLPDGLSASHHMVVVATAFDEASRRIVTYLAEEHGVSINAAFFRFFEQDGMSFLASDWLKDVEAVVERAQERRELPWSGEWFINVASEPHRSWDDCRTLGFVSGAGDWAEELGRPAPGDRFYAYIKGRGYVGTGRVVGSGPQPINEFVLADGARLRDQSLRQPAVLSRYPSELGLAVAWDKTLPESSAAWFKGGFANQHICCRLRHRPTLDFLAEQFGTDATKHNDRADRFVSSSEESKLLGRVDLKTEDRRASEGSESARGQDT